MGGGGMVTSFGDGFLRNKIMKTRIKYAGKEGPSLSVAIQPKTERDSYKILVVKSTPYFISATDTCGTVGGWVGMSGMMYSLPTGAPCLEVHF